MNAPLRVIVLDILKAHKPTILELGKAICNHATVTSANISVYAIDEKTESVKVILEGKDIRYDEVKEIIENFGAAVHSIDKAVIGRKEVIEVPEGASERPG
jgi:hypothetical protein